MKKTRQTLKVGDIIEVGPNTIFKWTTGDMENVTKEDASSSNIGLINAKIIAITPSYISLDEPDYTGVIPFKTTFDELERVGILDIEKEEEFKIGDKVECISQEGFKEESSYVKVEGINIGDVLTVSSVTTYGCSRTPALNFKEKNQFTHPTSSFKKINNMSTEKVIKEYKVVTTFPTATKDYQVGEIVKKGTALFKKAHKFPAFFEAVYEDNGFKARDFVVIVSCDFSMSSYTVGNTYQLQSDYTPEKGWFLTMLDNNKSISNGYTGSNFYKRIVVRAATPAEIKAYNDTKLTKSVTVSNNNITLIVNKDGLVTAGSKGTFRVSQVKALQDALYSVNKKPIGPWETLLVESNARIIRIGCSGEDFRVSYNDLSKVIDAYNSL